MADLLRHAVFDLISTSLRSASHQLPILTAALQNARLQTPTLMVSISRTLHSTLQLN